MAPLALTALLSLGAVVAHAQVVISVLPNQNGGPASDTDFISTSSGLRTSQLLADDFTLGSAAAIRDVTWWGFYGGDVPPVTEVMRIRFYDARADGLPGAVQYEFATSNFTRTGPGGIVFTEGGPHEYQYHMQLPAAFLASAGARYWFEVVQLGDVNSRFRWETGSGDHTGHVFINPNVPDWGGPGSADLAFQLSTIPEPATALLACLALLARVRKRAIPAT